MPGKETNESEQQRLRECLLSPFPEVRRHGARRAGEEGLSDLAEPLAAQLQDPEPGVRREVARALGRLEVKEVVPQLLELLEDPDPGVALDAAWALGCIGGPGGEALVEEEPEPPGRSRWASSKTSTAASSEAPGSRPHTGLEVFSLVALLGFALGRYLPPFQSLLTDSPAAPGTALPMSRDQARALLYPGSDVISRIGVGASLTLDHDPDGLRLLSRAIDDFLFPGGIAAPRPLRLDRAMVSDGSELVEDPWPDVEPDRRPTSRPPVSRPTNRSPTRDSSGAPGTLAGVERELYREAALRYLRAGDRKQALELMTMATGRELQDADLEPLLAGR